MNKHDKEAIRLVLEELYRRTPKTSGEGFLPSRDVKEAVSHLLEKTK
jgi:hypothetical protein